MPLTALLANVPATAPPTAAGANNATCGQHTRARLACTAPAVSAAAATTASEVVVAVCTSSPRTYTSSGTASTAPPPPTAPSEKPIASPSGTAAIIASGSRGLALRHRPALARPLRHSAVDHMKDVARAVPAQKARGGCRALP